MPRYSRAIAEMRSGSAGRLPRTPATLRDDVRLRCPLHAQLMNNKNFDKLEAKVRNMEAAEAAAEAAEENVAV